MDGNKDSQRASIGRWRPNSAPHRTPEFGTGNYQASNMCVPNPVDSLSYDELCALLHSRYSKPEKVHLARKRFYAASRNGEQVRQLLLRLKELAVPCQFGPRFNQVLLDKMVSLQEGRVFDRLCEEDEHLTLEQAVKIILRIEVLNRIRQHVDEQAEATRLSGNRWQPISASRFQPNSAPHPQWINQRQQEQRRTRCIHCGGTNHGSRECLHKKASCHLCRQTGHIATICQRRRSVNHRSIKDIGHCAQQELDFGSDDSE